LYPVGKFGYFHREQTTTLQRFIAPNPAGRARDAPPRLLVGWVGAYRITPPNPHPTWRLDIFASWKMFCGRPWQPRFPLLCFSLASYVSSSQDCSAISQSLWVDRNLTRVQFEHAAADRSYSFTCQICGCGNAPVVYVVGVHGVLEDYPRPSGQLEDKIVALASKTSGLGLGLDALASSHL